MHGLGRHRRALDLRRRRPGLARARAVRRNDAAQARLQLSCRSATATSASTSQPTPTSPGRCRPRVDKINALPTRPDFLLHTGDLTHLARSRRSSTRWTRFSIAPRPDQVFYVPGEHDVLGRRRQAVPRALRQRHARATAGTASTTKACTSSAWSTWCNLGRRPGRARRRAARLARRTM